MFLDFQWNWTFLFILVYRLHFWSYEIYISICILEIQHIYKCTYICSLWNPHIFFLNSMIVVIMKRLTLCHSSYSTFLLKLKPFVVLYNQLPLFLCCFLQCRKSICSPLSWGLINGWFSSLLDFFTQFKHNYKGNIQSLYCYVLGYVIWKRHFSI